MVDSFSPTPLHRRSKRKPYIWVSDKGATLVPPYASSPPPFRGGGTRWQGGCGDPPLLLILLNISSCFPPFSIPPSVVTDFGGNIKNF